MTVTHIVEEDLWAEEERVMRAELLAGRAAVANGHRHKAIIAWAMSRDMARYITAFRPRPTVWGNPFRPKGSARSSMSAHRLGTERFRTYLLGKPDLLARLPELHGKLLICYCKPLPCHGDVLVQLINDGL